MPQHPTGELKVAAKHLFRIKKKDPLGWIALEALDRLSHEGKGSVVVCTGAGHGYFGKVAIDPAGGVLRSMAAVQKIVQQEGESLHEGKERDAVLSVLIETPRPSAVIIRDVDLGMKLVDSVFAIAKKKAVKTLMIFWKRGHGYFHEAHRIMLIMASMHEMEIAFASAAYNGEILFAITRKGSASSSGFPVGSCLVNDERTSAIAG